MRKPDFITIGAMKCATSTLHEQLAAQSGIFMSTPKEPNFFSDDDQFARGVQWYFDLFAGANGAALCGESSTHYTKLPRHPRTVERIAAHVPEARFIYVMRHPVDRLVSQYIHEWTQRVLDDPIGVAVETHPALVDFGLYTRQLEPYFEAFGRDRVLPVFFDRLRAHPQAELERVCRFIGYEEVPTWTELEAQNISAQRMRNSWLRDALVYAPVISTIRRRLVPQWLRDRIKTLWTMQRRPTLTDGQLRSLKARFDPDLARLGKWLGVELSCDAFVERTRDQALEWVTR